jgi:hypothetical protein
MWKLQGGSYIPGVSGIGHQVGLARDVAGSLKGIDDFREDVGKYGGRLGIAGRVGQFLGGKALKQFGGKKIASMLAKTAFGSTPLGMLASVAAPMALEGLGKFGGGEAMKALARKFGFAKKPTSPKGEEFGLHQDKYKELGELPGQIESELTGASAGEALGGLSLNEMWKNLPGGKESAGGVLERARTQIGKWNAGRTGQSGFEGTSMGNLFGMDISGGRTPFGGAGNTLLPGYGGFEMNPSGDISSTGFHNLDWGNQQGGYMQGYQSGGALGKSFGLSKPSFNTYNPDTGDWWSMVNKLAGDTDARKKALAELGGMEHAESAKESEDIYQKSLPIREQTLKGISSSILSDLPSGIMGAKDISSAMQNYLEGQEFFRQQDPTYGQPIEIFDNPFTGEPLEELRPNVPYSQSETSNEEYRQQQLKKLLGMQQGGSISPYNLGGSVTQQPMAYQLGGLLKYKRSPMMG